MKPQTADMIADIALTFSLMGMVGLLVWVVTL